MRAGPARLIGKAAVLPTTIAVTQVVVTSSTPTNLNVGQTHQITVDTKGLNLQTGDLITVTGRTVTYASSNAGVATVSGSGLVTGAGVGSVTITITCEGASTTAAYVITTPQNAVDHVTITPASLTINTSMTYQLAATVYDVSNNVLTGKTVTWASSSPSIATIGADSGTDAHTATLTTLTGAGSTNITATCGAVNSTALAVTVQVPAGSQPNKPGGLTTTMDERFLNDGVDAGNGGFGHINSQSWNNRNTAYPGSIGGSGYRMVNDLTDPTGDGQVCEIVIPATNFGGSSTMVWNRFNMSGHNYTKMYGQLYFKVDSTFCINTVLQKFSWRGGPGTSLLGWFICLKASTQLADPFQLQCNLNVNGVGYGGNVVVGGNYLAVTGNSGDPSKISAGTGAGTPNLARGQWHLLETYAQLNTPGNFDGILRIWTDNVLILEHTDMKLVPDGQGQYWSENDWLLMQGGGAQQYQSQGSLYLSNLFMAHAT